MVRDGQTETASSALLGARAPVFVSYSSADVVRVESVVARLAACGVALWRDGSKILGGENFGPAIVAAIETAPAIALMCSESSLRSRNVQQEIQLAWEYGRPCLPLLIDELLGRRYPRQLQYWLQGTQWIEVVDHDEGRWLPRVLASLAALGVACDAPAASHEQIESVRVRRGFEAFKSAFGFTDRMWPVRVDAPQASGFRTLRFRPNQRPHRFRIGDYVRLVLEPTAAGHLILLNQASSGEVCCLCPSNFVTNGHIDAVPTLIPSADDEDNAFLISGPTGREHLVAIVTQEPLALPFAAHSAAPPSVLSADDVDAFARALRDLPTGGWQAFSTFFDTVP